MSSVWAVIWNDVEKRISLLEGFIASQWLGGGTESLASCGICAALEPSIVA